MAPANLLISFWEDTLLTIVYILNRVPSNSTFITLYQLWHGRKPSLDHLRPWDLTGYVHNSTHKYGKFSSRATKMVFIRYPEYSKGYVMFGEHPNGGMTKIDSRYVEFLEDELPSVGKIKNNLKLYKLQPDDPPSLGEGKNLHTHNVTENSALPVSRRNYKIWLLKRINM